MKLRVTVNGVAYDVEVEILEDHDAAFFPFPAPALPAAVAPMVKHPAHAAAAKPKILVSPIPGTVLEVNAAVGQRVKAGDPVIILDAMKMNTQIPAPADAVVKEILVRPGDAVKMSQPLIVFE